MSWPSESDIALYLGAGATVGAVYFILLLRTVRLLASHATATRILPLCVLRVATAILAFWIIAQRGAPALLLALLGFLAARIAFQRWAGSE